MEAADDSPNTSNSVRAENSSLGHGAYGVEAASRLYFDKRARDLSIEEAALIAGLVFPG